MVSGCKKTERDAVAVRANFPYRNSPYIVFSQFKFSEYRNVTSFDDTKQKCVQLSNTLISEKRVPNYICDQMFRKFSFFCYLTCLSLGFKIPVKLCNLKKKKRMANEC